MKEEYVIINKTAVLKRIEELEQELAYHTEWYKKARENYDKDRKFWGQADDGEMRVASDAALTSAQETKILKQILSQSTPLIPEIEKAFNASKITTGMNQRNQFAYKYKSSQDYISNLKIDI